MPTPTETVDTFLSLWDRPGGLAQAIRDYFTEETVWENVGMSKTTGVKPAMAVLEGFGQDADTLMMKVDTTSIAAQGGADKAMVLTERIDHFLDPAGNSVMAFPVMGIFEVAGGKILAWRDYFDSAGFADQWKGMP